MEKINQDGKITSGSHISIWTDTIPPLRYTPLDENLETEVVIVGGGIAGVSIAYQLLKSGKKIILVEDGTIGSGETGRTTAHLVTALDDRYYNLEKIHGIEGSQLAFESHASAIDFVETIIKNENINCDFERVNGYLFQHSSDHFPLDNEYEAALRAGIKIQRLTHVPGFKNGQQNCLCFPNQAQFHPLKYIHALCKLIIAMGGEIYTETHANEINSEGIAANEFKIKAKHIVIATNTPVNNLVVMHLKQFSYRTYVLGFKIKKGSQIKALWWDTGDRNVNAHIPPYHYVRIAPYNNEYDILISGGEDHATGLAEADDVAEEFRYKSVEAWTRVLFNVEDIVYKWSGQVMEPMDSLAFIGHNPMDKDNVYIVTGDSGNGMTHSAIAAMLITDLINGKKNKWEKLYDPSRFKIFKAGNVFFSELKDGIINYLKLKPKNTDASLLYDLKSGEGIVVKIDGEKFGAYRDKEDLHFVSAVCTHLKCIVKWNNDEKSWDCPCHGSRFTYEGNVINGPANSNLDYYVEKKFSFAESVVR